MQDGDVVAKARAEAAHGLGRERDLGHEDEGSPSLGTNALDGVEVYLGLARARDAVNQDHVAAAGTDGLVDGGERGLLAGGEALGTDGVRTGEGGRVSPTHAPAMRDRDHAALDQRVHHAGDARHHGRELGHAHGSRREGLDEGALAAGGLGRLEVSRGGRELDPAVVDGCRLLAHELPGGVLGFAAHAHGLPGGDEQAQAFREGCRVLVGHPGGELGRALVERGRGEDALDGAYLGGVQALGRLVGHGHDVAHRRAPGKGDQHGGANEGLVRQLLGDGVVVRVAEGARGYVGNDACVAHGGLSGRVCRRSFYAFAVARRLLGLSRCGTVRFSGAVPGTARKNGAVPGPSGPKRPAAPGTARFSGAVPGTGRKTGAAPYLHGPSRASFARASNLIFVKIVIDTSSSLLCN